MTIRVEVGRTEIVVDTVETYAATGSPIVSHNNVPELVEAVRRVLRAIGSDITYDLIARLDTPLAERSAVLTSPGTAVAVEAPTGAIHTGEVVDRAYTVEDGILAVRIRLLGPAS